VQILELALDLRSTFRDNLPRFRALACSMTNSRTESVPQAGVAPGPVAEGHVRVSIMVQLPQLLWELGLDPAEVLPEVGVDPSLLADPENRIEFHTAGRMLEHCVARTGCHHLGLLLGKRSEVAALGIVGLLVQESPDVGTALGNLTEHLHLHDRGGVATLEFEGEVAMLGYAVYKRDTPGCDQIHAASLAVANVIMRGLCGAAWRAREVLLAFRRPADVEPFQRVFRAPVRFDADRCALVFPAALLRKPVVKAKPEAYRALKTLAAALESRSNDEIVSKTKRTLRALLIAGHAQEDVVARAFAVHRRTLNRRLRAEGVTFRQVLDETRLEVARQMLRDSNADIEQIAGGLGYSGASAFGRAFRRWTGLAPHEWREQLLGDSDDQV